jgi:lactoylglutathione lyase
VIAPFHHVGVAVTDLEAAMREVGAARGLTWARVQDLTLEGHRIRFTYSIEGPPHVELLQGEPGGPWGVGAGPHMHHVGLFTSDLEADRARLEAAGLTVDLAGRGFTYHSGPAGLRIELVDERARPAFERWLAGGDFA